jgi:three-Cys-motif partner protein
MARAWGVWTRSKLELLAKYLDAFTTATKKKSKYRVYLDLFGGQPENVDRTTQDPIDGSARIALDTDDQPFTHLRFFELPPNATRLRQTLEQQYPGRDFIVYEGDCNQTIHEALADLHRADAGWAPTFAFIDPNGPHCHWSTLEALACHKGPEASTKVELWMLFPVPLFQRMLPRDGIIRLEDDYAITQMYGTPAWHAIYEAKLQGWIEPKEASQEYVNLMRWRLHNELGYKWTYDLLVRNAHDRPIYYMLFASDSDPGRDIMRWLYQEALDRFPQMREENRQIEARLKREAVGQFDLFSTVGMDVPIVVSSRAEEQLPETPPEEPRPHDPDHCPFCDRSAWDLYEVAEPDSEDGLSDLL